MTAVDVRAGAPVVPSAPELGDAALRDAVRALADARVDAAHAAGDVRRRWQVDDGALSGDAGAAVEREVALFARAARRGGAPLPEVLVAVAAAVRAAGEPMAVGPREAAVREANRCCVKAFSEARAAPTPGDGGSDRR
jgi:hypothetical protein